jgi:hypothetical protein
MAEKSVTPSKLLTLNQVADMLQVSPRTLQRLPIRFFRVGNQRRYDWPDVQQYLDRKASRKKFGP